MALLPSRERHETRGVLVTAAGPGMREVLHDLSLPTFHAYARRWGYAVQAHDLPSDGRGADPAAQLAKWAKLQVVRSALREHPLVVWLDADVLLMRTDEDVAALLRPRAFQGLALERVPSEQRTNPNTGVWVLRSCPMTLAFLDLVAAAGQQPGPWADQGAVLRALGWHRGDDTYRGPGPDPGTRSPGAPRGCRPGGTSRSPGRAARPTASTARATPTRTGLPTPTPVPCTSWG